MQQQGILFNQKMCATRLVQLLLKPVLLILIVSIVYANYAVAQNSGTKSGRVMARSVVIDPDTGEPILVEYNTDGTEAGPVSIGSNSVFDVSILAASEYQAYKTQLDDYLNQYVDTLAVGAEVLTRVEFQQASFLAADNQTTITQSTLPEGVNSVLVRGQSNRIVPDPSQLVLLRFAIDMTQDVQITDNDVSIVVNTNGQIIAQSTNNIGYRTGFFGDPSEVQDDRGFSVGQDDTVFGPIAGVKVKVDEHAYPGGISVTDNEGKYSFRFYMPPCPLGGWTFTTDVWAELKYKNFLPIGAPSIPYYLRTPGYTACTASFSRLGLYIPGNVFSGGYQSNLYADVMFVTGRITIQNINGDAVEFGDTTYSSFDQAAENTTQNYYDFNGDGQSDYVLQGKIETRTDDNGDEYDVFVADQDNGDKQGIFFDGAQDDEFDFPDLIRVIDQEIRSDEPVGVLESISSADMRNTDVLFFRESTGQLILERRGLKEEESNFRRAIQYDEEENEVAYRIMLRGPNDSTLNVGGGVLRSASYEEWATQNQLTEPFQSRESDSPRTGEFIKIVAMNRATGYIGTARVQLLSGGDNGTGLLDVSVPPITMYPPNLKIWAERNYEVESGLTQGEDRTYTIGSEGAALTSDTTITIYSEWLDHNGRPLPDELSLDDGEQYGLTGRLAKVVGANTLQGVSAGSDLAEFPIAPGRHTQVIRVGDNLSTAEHFYIHVIGKPKDQECVNDSSCPSFSQTGSTAPYDSRPELLTPFLVPLADEDQHWQEYSAYRQLLSAQEEEPTTQEEIIRPLPAYAWQYRPEYQFSHFELEIGEINRTFTDSEGNEQSINLLNEDTPIIFSEDDYISAFYDLVSSQFDRISPIDGEQDLLLVFGEEEVRITVGEDQTLTFENINHLTELEAEDFLSIRLYANNDASNVLWEWAFAYVAFVDEYGDQVALGQNFSYPKPVVQIGKNKDLDDFTINDLSLSGNVVSFTLHGRVTSHLADIVPDGLADVYSVTIVVPNNTQDEGFDRIEVPLTLNETDVIPQDEYLPIDSNEEGVEIGHTYIGEFQYGVSYLATKPNSSIMVEARNAVGLIGLDSVSIGVELNIDESNLTVDSHGHVLSGLTAERITRVSNGEGTDDGLYQPLWVEVIDGNLNDDNYQDAKVDFLLGTERLAKRLDIVKHPKSGKFYGNLAFIALANQFDGDQAFPDNILDVYSIDDSLTSLAYYAPVDVDEIPTTPLITHPSVTAKNFLNWGYTAGSPPNYYTFIENTNVGINWYSDLVDSEGFEILSVEAVERNSGRTRTRWQEDSDIEVIGDATALNQQEIKDGNDRVGFTIPIRIKSGAINKNEKCLEISFQYTSDFVGGDTLTGRARAACFRIDTPKIILFAIDGLGYDGAINTIQNIEENAALPEIFKADAILNSSSNGGLPEPVLSALPTITWANWPGVFSGQPPKEHGILGNSYMPREIEQFPIPVYSAGVPKTPLNSAAARLQLYQQLNVATLDFMKTMAFDEADSIYDHLAGQFNKPNGERLNFYAIHTFYNKYNEDEVKQEDVEAFRARAWGPGNSTEHNWTAAKFLDDEDPAKCDFTTWAGVTCRGLIGIDDDFSALIGLGNGAGPELYNAWATNRNSTDVFSAYFPGPDNVGHGIGNTQNGEYNELALDLEINEPDHKGFKVNQDALVNSIAAQAMTVTDSAISRVWSRIKADGYQNAVLFGLAADHGQHQFIGHDHNKDPDAISIDTQRAYEYNIFVEDIERIFEESVVQGGLNRVVWTGQEPGVNYVVSSLRSSDTVFSGNGGLGQIYLKDSTWNEAPSAETVVDSAVLLHHYASNKSPQSIEALDVRFRDIKISPRPNVQLESKGINDNEQDTYLSEHYNSSVTNDGRFITDGAFGYPAAIFVRRGGFNSPYEWLDVRYQYENEDGSPHSCMSLAVYSASEEDCFSQGLNYAFDETTQRPKLDGIPQSRPIQEFLDARKNRIAQLKQKGITDEDFNWPSFEPRLQEMNGVRSGDIIVLTDGREGYMTLDNESESFIGWHGGATESESLVPLFLSMPGTAFVDESGQEVGAPNFVKSAVASAVEQQKNLIGDQQYIRNWHLSQLMSAALGALRKESE